MKSIRLLVMSLLVWLLAACATGGGERISEPTARVQQLRVDANGQWTVSVRLQNYSSTGMRFEQLALNLRFNESTVVALNAQPKIEIPAENADVIDVRVTPDLGAKLLVADALAAGRNLPYTLGGRLVAGPLQGKARAWQIESKNNQLSPVPGMPGTLR